MRTDAAVAVAAVSPLLFQPHHLCDARFIFVAVGVTKASHTGQCVIGSAGEATL